MREDYTITFHAPPKKGLPQPFHCFVLASRRCGSDGVVVWRWCGGVRRLGLCISRVNCGHHHAGPPCLSHVRGAGSWGKLGSLICRAGVLFLLFNTYVWELKVLLIYLSDLETEYMPVKFLYLLEQVTAFTDNL